MIRFYFLLLFSFAAALPALGEDANPMSSILLIARRDLPDPFFRNSVVLVTNKGGPVPVGLILNRPTAKRLTSLFPEIEWMRSRDDRLFFGGPVDADELVVAFRSATPRPGTIEVLDGVYVSSSPESMRALLGREQPADGLRVFAGHASWGPGQLESEIARGDWHLIRADARTIFETKPEGLWRELERKASAVIALRSSASTRPERILSRP